MHSKITKTWWRLTKDGTSWVGTLQAEETRMCDSLPGLRLQRSTNQWYYTLGSSLKSGTHTILQDHGPAYFHRGMRAPGAQATCIPPASSSGTPSMNTALLSVVGRKWPPRHHSQQIFVRFHAPCRQSTCHCCRRCRTPSLPPVLTEVYWSYIHDLPEIEGL